MHGIAVFIGSGELAPSMTQTHRHALERTGARAVTILDTPYGFQENADELSRRIANYFETRLHVEATVASLRRLGSELDRARAISIIERSEYVFAGPGSPGYAARLWSDLRLGPVLTDVIRRGGAVILASAAAVVAGARAIPVYEIYKAGEDPHWLKGMDITAPLGLNMVVVPHWNNAEGGTHDTSRCYIGARRFEAIEQDLDVGVVGIDEHTSITFDFGLGRVRVAGVGQVTVRGRRGELFITGEIGLADVIDQLGGPMKIETVVDTPEHPFSFQEALEQGDTDAAVAVVLEAIASDDRSFPSMVVELGELARRGLVERREIIGPFVDLLVDLRSRARDKRRYEESDRIRDALAALGVEVRDTPEGVTWL